MEEARLRLLARHRGGDAGLVRKALSFAIRHRTVGTWAGRRNSYGPPGDMNPGEGLALRGHRFGLVNVSAAVYGFSLYSSHATIHDLNVISGNTYRIRIQAWLWWLQSASSQATFCHP